MKAYATIELPMRAYSAIRHFLVALALLLAIPQQSAGRSASSVSQEPACGVFPGRGALELARHRHRERRGLAQGYGLRAASVEAAGEIALIEADPSIVAEPNPFDLRGRSLAFVPLNPEASSYRLETDGSAFEPALGEPVALSDDDSRPIDLAFEFPFFGRRARQAFLNSDGNLTLSTGDNASTERSLTRFLSGAPRIALFFNDLNPEAGGEVRVASLPDRLLVSWDRVPEFDTTNRNTFQVVLEPSGRIAFRFTATVDATAAVVGITAGANPPQVNLVDLSGEGVEGGGAIAERFLPERVVDNVAAVRRFYQAFPDRFELLVLWSKFSSDLDDAFAFETTVSNSIRGIGVRSFNDTSLWGSAGRLESVVQMGELSRYPSRPDQRILRIGGHTTLSLLAHETAHRWLVTVRFDDQARSSDELLGRQLAHWSFFVDTDGSFLEGNDIEDRGGGNFATVGRLSRYSSADLYLMGLAPAAEVAPFFFVAHGSGTSPSGEVVDRESGPEVGVTLAGERRDVLLDDIVRIEGARRPDFPSSPKEFRQAFILLYLPGNPPTAEELSRLDAARTAWEAFFREETLGRAGIATTLGQ